MIKVLLSNEMLLSYQACYFMYRVDNNYFWSVFAVSDWTRSYITLETLVTFRTTFVETLRNFSLSHKISVLVSVILLIITYWQNHRALVGGNLSS